MHYIYFLINKINNKIYVGQTNNLSKRKREHKAKDRLITKKTSHLYQAIKKWGFENFWMMHIETYASPEEADAAEIFWIKCLNSRDKEKGYNHAEGGKVNRGYKHTEQFKEKKSHQMKKMYLDRRSPTAKFNNEDINYIRKAFLTGNYSLHKLSKIFNSNKKSIKSIVMNLSYKNINYDPPIEFIKNILNKNKNKRFNIYDQYNNKFFSLKDAALYYNVTEDTIKRHIKKPKIKSKNNLP